MSSYSTWRARHSWLVVRRLVRYRERRAVRLVIKGGRPPAQEAQHDRRRLVKAKQRIAHPLQKTKSQRVGQPEPSHPLACCIVPEMRLSTSSCISRELVPVHSGTCQSVPRVHSRFGTRTLLCKTYEPDMQTPGELSDSSLSPADVRGRIDSPHRPSQLIDFTRVRGVLDPLLNSRTKLRLRTKLLLSLVSFTAVLTCATLLVVRRSAQVQVQKQIEQDARNAVLTIQAVQHQREMLMSRKADLLATLAHMRHVTATTIPDAAQDTWQSDDCDLFALADRKGKIIALHTTISTVSTATAEKLLRRSLKDDSGAGWWFGDGHLFQVVLQPYYQDEPRHTPPFSPVIIRC